MGQLFPKYSTLIGRLLVPALLLGVVVTAGALHTAYFSSYATDTHAPVEQPVPFSHEHHVAGLGIDCRYCHTSVETSSFAGIPPTETCMTCHSQVWRDAPVLQPVRDSWATGKPMRWTRVHDLPDYVYFDHSIHVQNGVACVECHGRVDQMPLMSKQHSLYMRWCVDCHRAPESHQGPVSQVFAMQDLPSSSRTMQALVQKGEMRGELPPYLEHGIQAVHEGTIRNTRLEDCSICHR